MIKTFIAFVQKETYHILRDTRTLIILFGMPIALVLIFGYTVTNEFKDASMAIVDQSKDKLSQALVEHLTSSGHFQLIETLNNAEEVKASFQAGKTKLGIIIPPQFEKDFYKNNKATLQLLTDASEPNYATTLTSYANQMVIAFQQKYSGNYEHPLPN